MQCTYLLCLSRSPHRSTCHSEVLQFPVRHALHAIPNSHYRHTGFPPRPLVMQMAMDIAGSLERIASYRGTAPNSVSKRTVPQNRIIQPWPSISSRKVPGVYRALWRLQTVLSTRTVHSGVSRLLPHVNFTFKRARNSQPSYNWETIKALDRVSGESFALSHLHSIFRRQSISPTFLSSLHTFRSVRSYSFLTFCLSEPSWLSKIPIGISSAEGPPSLSYMLVLGPWFARLTALVSKEPL
jgi:hypothetical protein